MTQRDESDRHPVAPMELTVRITPECELYPGKRYPSYRRLGRSTVQILDLNGVVVLTAAAVPDDEVPTEVAEAIRRWGTMP